MKKASVLLMCLILVAFSSGCTKKDVKYAEAPEKANAETGAWEGNVYRGEFTGITFTLPSGWEKVSADELLEAMGEKEGITYDMMCQNENTGSHVMVSYEELLKSAGTASITEEDYLKIVSDNLYNMGFNVSDISETVLCGETFYMIRAYGEGEGIKVNQYSLVRREKGYMISVIINAVNEDSFEDILNCFSE